ncbi:hypothetical protein QAD02_009271 [Eretmocerus hayati]|uniref:Uncharacterized protein n=1 Tax=Eretmocerus hayati TaxID=131215 RepID=A0ACC2NA27_9HYME|nr:hypothetical protein QAD02_009271 [Eretmocerus hayati]
MLTLYISQDNHPSADGFIEFGKKIMDPILCQELEEQTRNQSEDPLWEAVRYARVTASKLDEVAHCKTPEGSLCKQIIGVSKVHDTKYMKRGRILEQQIFDELYRRGYKVSKCGIFILPAYSILGGSPDGISDGYILEIKCPASESTFKNYLHNGNITPKYKAQMMLQMFVARKRKGLFCVAHWDFETNHKISLLWVDFDQDFLMPLIERSSIFWKKNIYPLLSKNVCE